MCGGGLSLRKANPEAAQFQGLEEGPDVHIKVVVGQKRDCVFMGSQLPCAPLNCDGMDVDTVDSVARGSSTDSKELTVTVCVNRANVCTRRSIE